MERFKAVEKEMKTKAYSKEGLSLASKMDPKEKEKIETIEFLQSMNEEIERQVEMYEAEIEGTQATMKKGKKDFKKAERLAELEQLLEQHKWHQNKLNLLQRALDNGNVEAEQIKDVEDSIRYYVEQNQEADFMYDDSIYDDFNLHEEENLYGMTQDADRPSSPDAQSNQGDQNEGEGRPAAPSTAPPRSRRRWQQWQRKGAGNSLVQRSTAVCSAQVASAGAGNSAFHPAEQLQRAGPVHHEAGAAAHTRARRASQIRLGRRRRSSQRPPRRRHRASAATAGRRRRRATVNHARAQP